MGNRIKELRTAKRLSMEALGRLVGTSRQQIFKLEKGLVRLTVDWMKRLSIPLGVKPEELMLPEDRDQGAKRMAKDQMPSDPLTLFRESPVALDPQRMPILGRARGNREGAFHMPVEQEPIAYTVRPRQLEGVLNAYGLYVFDNSMAEKYVHGQVLWVHPDMPARPGDGVVVVKKNDEALIKILVRRTARAVILRQLNPDEEFEILTDSIRSIHRVIGAIDPI